MRVFWTHLTYFIDKLMKWIKNVFAMDTECIRSVFPSFEFIDLLSNWNDDVFSLSLERDELIFLIEPGIGTDNRMNGTNYSGCEARRQLVTRLEEISQLIIQCFSRW